jgi:hypothetical protein
MSEELSTGLAATANDSVADSPTPDTVLDAAFASPEPAAGLEPSADPEPAPEPAAAIAQPQTPVTPSGTKGEPPRERWDSILENARIKAREEALAAHKDQLEVVQRLREDFPGTLAQLLEEGSIDPRFSEQLTSRAAAILAARNKQVKADIEPEPDLQTADGALVYSADQLRKWHQWNNVQSERKLTEQFKPLQQLQQRFEQHQQQVQMAQEAASVAEERGATWKSMPFFADHKAAILSRQAELYAEAQAAAQRGERRFDPVNTPWEALQRAYSEVVSTQALPKFQSQQTDSLVAQAARKRAGSSSDPAATAPAQPRRPRTVDEALDQVFSSVL